MNFRLSLHLPILALLATALVSACSTPPVQSPAPEPRGTGDLGVVIERAAGRVGIVDTSQRKLLASVGGLGDLSHASAVFSRDGRYAYVFGRDGGLTKVDLLAQRIAIRIKQAGNSIGGAITQDGRYVVAQNYEPGGIKVFDAATLAPVADVPAEFAPGRRSKVVGLVDLPGHRVAYALFDAGEIWITDLSDPAHPSTRRFPAGKQPYDGLVTPDGRYYLAGLFGEDGVAVLDTWHPERGVRKVLTSAMGQAGAPGARLPVYKMPHLRGWAIAQNRAYLPAIGRHEVVVVALGSWEEVARIPVRAQPVFVVASPDQRSVWVNFAHPDNGHVQVIDTDLGQVVTTLAPGRAVLHLEFTPRGHEVWISSRDDHRVVVYDVAGREQRAVLPFESPSGILFTSRANRIGF